MIQFEQEILDSTWIVSGFIINVVLGIALKYLKWRRAFRVASLTFDNAPWVNSTSDLFALGIDNRVATDNGERNPVLQWQKFTTSTALINFNTFINITRKQPSTNPIYRNAVLLKLSKASRKKENRQEADKTIRTEEKEPWLINARIIWKTIYFVQHFHVWSHRI